MIKKNENNMNEKPQYTCAICNSTYDDVQQRMNCEMGCIKKVKEEEKRVAEEKAKAEKYARQHEVTAALDNAFTLVNKFVEDYGVYQYNGKVKDLNMANMDFFPSKLWHHIWC